MVHLYLPLSELREPRAFLILIPRLTQITQTEACKLQHQQSVMKILQ